MWNFATARGDRGAPAGARASTRSRCWLENKPVQPDDPYAFTTTVTMGPHLARLPEEKRRAFAEAVLELEDDPLTLELRPPQHRRPPCLGSSLLPGDGIGPEIGAAARRGCWRRSASSRSTSTRSAAPRSTSTAPLSPTRCSRPAAPPTRCCSAPSAVRSGTRPIPTSRGPSRACSACARGSGCSRTCGRFGPARPCSRPARCAASGSRAPTCSSCASSPAASTSATRAATATAPTTTAPTRSRRSSGSPASASRRRGERRGQAHLGGQGERAGDLAALARDGHEAGAGVRGDRARPPARRQRRDAARLAAGRVRRDRHREPLRRHPQRRGGDAHRLARDAALGEPGGERSRVCSSPCTARPPTSPGTGRRQPAGDLALRGDDAPLRARACTARPIGSRRRWTPRSAEGLRTPDLAGGEGTREVGTEEMTKAVIAGL